MNNKEKFRFKICDKSVSNNFDIGKREWHLDHIEYKSNGDGECICGKTHGIYYQCFIKNSSNNRILKAGRTCVNEHLSWNITEDQFERNA